LFTIQEPDSLKPEQTPDTRQLAEGLISLMPLFHRALIRPSTVMSRNNLSPLQHQTLLILTSGGPLTMSELAGRLMVAKQQLTPIVDRLQTSGFVSRIPDSKDRRQIRLQVTPKAQQFMNETRDEFIAIFSQKLSVLDAGEQARLAGLLSEFGTILGKLGG